MRGRLVGVAPQFPRNGEYLASMLPPQVNQGARGGDINDAVIALRLVREVGRLPQ